VVSVLATGPKVRGFDPDRGRWIFKDDKNPEHHFLRTINAHKRNSSGRFSPTSPDCLPDGSGGHIRMELKSAAGGVVTN
jgi:hypothetical protein